MENRRNYYRILHVQPGAPPEIIRASYRTLMQRLRAHPDLGGDHWNAALINEAYAVLTDAARRAEYDREFRMRVIDARHETDHPVTGPGAATAPVARCHFCAEPHPVRPTASLQAVCRRCDSPLHLPTPGDIGPDGRRTVQRFPRNHPLTLYTHWPQSNGFAALSRDVSLAGVSFVTTELIEPRAVVKLDSDICRAVVEIANLRMDAEVDRWLVGARFLSVVFPHARGTFLATQA
ncbi:MAG: J domain-containing protein [Gammaproteobacteria bacterium]|nr:J domain-containing protein [Gammaproteobacteria bacterium]